MQSARRLPLNSQTNAFGTILRARKADLQGRCAVRARACGKAFCRRIITHRRAVVEGGWDGMLARELSAEIPCSCSAPGAAAVNEIQTGVRSHEADGPSSANCFASIPRSRSRLTSDNAAHAGRIWPLPRPGPPEIPRGECQSLQNPCSRPACDQSPGYSKHGHDEMAPS